MNFSSFLSLSVHLHFSVRAKKVVPFLLLVEKSLLRLKQGSQHLCRNIIEKMDTEIQNASDGRCESKKEPKHKYTSPFNGMERACLIKSPCGYFGAKTYKFMPHF